MKQNFIPVFIMSIIIFFAANKVDAQKTIMEPVWQKNTSEGWIVYSKTKVKNEWRFQKKRVEAGNESGKACEKWLVSPTFGTKTGDTYTIIFERARSDSENGTLSVYYATDYNEETNEATWKLIDEAITAPEKMGGKPLGWNGGDGFLKYTKALDNLSGNVNIGFKYTSSGYDDNGTPDEGSDDKNKNRVRIKKFKLTTSGEIIPVEGEGGAKALPYSCNWENGESFGWTTVDSLYESKTWTLLPGKSYVAISDSQTDNNDWFISPYIDCSKTESVDVKIDLGWYKAKSSNVSLYYSTNYVEGEEGAQWTLIKENVIPQEHGFGTSSALRYKSTTNVKLNNKKVSFAIKYHKFGEFEEFQNNIRVHGFKVVKSTASGINEKQIDTVGFYPNPVNDVVCFNANITGEAFVYDILGRLVIQTAIVNNKIDVSSLPCNNYILKIKSQNKVFNFHFIKK